MASDCGISSVVSYNCRGYNASKREYIRSFMNSASIIMLQEHWLSDGQLYLLGDISDSFLYSGVSGFDNSEVLIGRPYGGCAILWRSDLAVTVKVVNTESKRVCAIRMVNEQVKLLLVSVYMPYESDLVSTEEYTDQLMFVENILFNNCDCHVIIAGDFNVDFSRSWPHTALLNSFCDNHGLIAADRHSKNTVDYTYQFNMERFCTLDHFLLSGTIFEEFVSSVSVSHDIDNLSDHEVITLQLRLEFVSFGAAERTFSSRVSWVKATNNDLCKYQYTLSAYLKSIRLPVETLLCADAHCCNASHSQAINAYADNIIEACISAGEAAIPLVSSRSASRRVPGWSEFVQPARDKSLFWHKLWVDCGRPRSGAVADCMRRTRAAYHYAIRKVRDDEDHITRDRFATALYEHDDRNFWLEVRRIRSKAHSLSGVIDGKHDEESISDLFTAKYQKLYTSVSYEASEMGSIINDLNVQLSNCSAIADQIKFSDVDDAVRKLKPHKSDCCDGLSSDHILNAGSDCLIHIALFFFYHHCAWEYARQVLVEHC